jgi:TonB family protein
MLLSKEGSMSSIRIASASCVLALALGAGSWGAAQAFPLYASTQIPPPPPPPPPRDPLSPEAYSRLGVLYFEQLRRSSLTDSQKIEIIGKGIAAEDRALELMPNYADAMIWKAILLHTQANLAANSVDRDRLMNEVDALRVQAELLYDSGRAYVSRDAISGPPPPPPPPPPRPRGGVPGGVPGGVTGGVPGGVAGGAQAEMVFVPARPTVEMGRALNAVRVGGAVKQPTKIRDVKPVYPALARQAGVTGVVILEVVIDEYGDVAEGRVLRSIPLLDEAALDAVKEWKYVPPQVNGAPGAVVMTVTVNFSLQ